MKQPSIFDKDAAIAARDEAVDRVDRNAADDWKSLADQAIEATALRFRRFSADDVWKILDSWEVPRPREARAFGPRMLAAVRRGVCEPTGDFHPSERAELHRSPIRIYRSLIFG